VNKCSRRKLIVIPSPTEPGPAAITSPSRNENAEYLALSFREWLPSFRRISPQKFAAWRAVCRPQATILC
jgi:hypothetical protein